MLQLLPPVCRDCGLSAEAGVLSPYLDFQLCASCISRREREVRAVDAARAPARGKKPAAGPKKKGGKPKESGKRPKRRR